MSGSTDDEVRELSTPGPVTYHEASNRYPSSTIAARERFEELTYRELSVRAFATLKARGTYDPQQHGDADKYEPLTTQEHLEILALGELLARYYRHPASVHQAIAAGASWAQVAEAVGSDEARVRREYLTWADGQHRLHEDYEGKFGMDDAEHAAAVRRAAEADREATG